MGMPNVRGGAVAGDVSSCDLAAPGPSQAVALRWFERLQSGGADADNLVDQAAASALRPGTQARQVPSISIGS
jgi:hypothetical protein